MSHTSEFSALLRRMARSHLGTASAAFDQAADQIDALRARLLEARSFVELTYHEEGGEEAADAKHVLDQIDAALAQ